MPTPSATNQGAGIPETGPGSLARFLPRLIALLIDWAACSLIAFAFLHYRWGTTNGAEGFKPMLVFAIENILLVSTLGYTLGHRLLGLQVQRVHGGAPGFIAGAVRTVLLLLVIPAIVTDSMGRGFHDRLAGTIIHSMR